MVVALLGIASPILAVVLLSGRLGQTPAVIQPEIIAEETFVVVREVTEETIVNVTLSGPAPQALVAGVGSGQGTVTATFVEPGSEIRDGSPVFAVDGVEHLAASTPEPFYRTLALRSQGPDVRALQNWLVGLGYLASGGVDGLFGQSTADAVEELNRNRGVPGDPVRSFSPSDVVWMPTASVVVEVTKLRVGNPAPATGEELLLGAQVYDQAEILLPDGSPASLPGVWELVVEDEVLGEVVNGTVSSAVIPLLADYGLRQSDQTADSESIERTATVRRVEPLLTSVVPAGTAISTPGETNETCVFVRDAGEYVPFATTVVGGDFGVVYIDPAPGETTPVLANPIEFLDNPQCT